jgi:hypothetical protein
MPNNWKPISEVDKIEGPKAGPISDITGNALGLIPRYAWHSQKNRERLQEIFAAMERYSRAMKPIPLEWILEFQEIWSRPIDSE